MIGAFVQLNIGSRRAGRNPIGYVVTESGCWEWVGAIAPTGYGVYTGQGGGGGAHRYVYKLLVGPIPEGLTLDHLCRNRLCVRPDHLEPVTMFENTMRGNTVAAVNAKKTHCPKGHPYEGDNVVRYPRHATWRVCKVCKYARNRVWWARRTRKKASAE